MSYSPKTFFLDNFVFQVPPQVYQPAEDSFLFAEYIYEDPANTILDVGTGCGILGIILASRDCSVTAIDINPYAIHCSKSNAKRNNVHTFISFFRCDLLSSIRTTATFDLIMFNAPYLPCHIPSKSWIERSWNGGIDGREIIDRFIISAPKYLARDGRILLLQSSLTNVALTVSKFAENDLIVKIVKKSSLPFFEEIILLQATFE
jgi:release factor glutamine methyltransferase